ncbi:MAG TPA: beta-ketoacyl-[acyl-carrier-protein] synthase family protein [Candidatus Cloacimonadota bacterium]|nr:beta-ketoacyl-[acyl-carrier-protein] synthase family protein [Candidatus Cloacimonadota bacterium]HPT71236.1 beta-ketoacyl-[acyl-carrier-protein] synthase family protein [Candidatus Cloacimonadota bacterium]
MKRRVVITGIGPVTSLGIGKTDFWNRILAGEKPEIRKIPEMRVPTKSKVYIPFPEFRITDYEIPQYYEFLHPEDKLAIIGAKLALDDAGFLVIGNNKKFVVSEETSIATVIGIGLTGFGTAFHSYLAHLGINNICPRDRKKPMFNRMVVPLSMNNSPAAWVSILFGLKNESYTISASCASGTYGIGLAFRNIADGYYDVALSGGVENLQDDSFMIFRGFDVLGALTLSETGYPQPFSQERSGFLFAEGGGCILVLEELEHARKRKANIYAEILDYQANSDAYNIVHIEPSGEQILGLIRKLVGNESIDYINTHGTATITNDEIEAKTIIDYFGDENKQPILNSTKGILGHTIGGSGAIETAVTALSISTNKIHVNLAAHPIPNLNLASETLDTHVGKAVSLSYGFGGHNAGLLLGKYHG